MDLERERTRQSTWRPIAGLEGLWHAERMVSGVPLRSVALRLADGRLAIYSPVRGLGKAAHLALTKIGQPAILIAPNHYHNLGLSEYAATYPGIATVGSTVAAPRLRRKCTNDLSDETLLRQAFPSNVSLLLPPGTKTGEVWISVESSNARVWIVGDAFFNIAKTPRSAMGLLLRILGISPGLRIGTSFRWLLKDRAVYRRWLIEALCSQQPTFLVPSHGDVLVSPRLPRLLERLAETRL
jgi:hypothetical protein